MLTRPLLEVDGVGKKFGGVVAVDGVSFTVAAGEVLGVVGPNGAGKSTLLALVAGSQRPTAGRVVFDGRRVDGLRPYRVARLGIGRTYQTPRAFPGLTVRDNLAVAAVRGRGRAAARLRTDDVLELTGLAAVAERDAGDLTLLQLKRLELARALAAEPSLLLLDEIGAGLNATELRRLLELLQVVRRSGVTMIVIEHVIDFILEAADRVVVMERGAVRAVGPPDEVARDPLVVDAYLGVDSAAAPDDRDDRGGATRPVPPDPVPGVGTSPASADAAGTVSATPVSAASSAAPRPALLAVQGLVVRYGKITALDGIDLEVPAGHAVAVLGPNGAGKSTLCRAVAGLARPSSGRIVVGGRDVTAWPADRRVRESGVALCPEGRQVFADQSVLENLLLGGVTARRDAAPRLEVVLDLFPELRDRTGQVAGTLSGGEQQMLAIGRALMSGPRLLVVDELSLGLTPQVAIRIYESLRRMLAEGLAFLVIEQHVGEALWMADRAYVLERGRVAFADTSRHIRENRAELAEIYVRATGSALAPDLAAMPREPSAPGQRGGEPA